MVMCKTTAWCVYNFITLQIKSTILIFVHILKEIFSSHIHACPQWSFFIWSVIAALTEDHTQKHTGHYTLCDQTTSKEWKKIQTLFCVVPNELWWDVFVQLRQLFGWFIELRWPTRCEKTSVCKTTRYDRGSNLKGAVHKYTWSKMLSSTRLGFKNKQIYNRSY